MKKTLIFSISAAAAVASFGVSPSFYDDFETNMYVQGQTLATNSWQASGAAAYVTNSGGVGGSRAAYIGEVVALTNSQSAAATLKVWTDFWVKPSLGGETPDLPTNTASFLFYFDSNGVVEVATGAGWLACTNDIWGISVPPVSNNYVRLSLFQDYNTSNQVVLLNDRVILQDFRFIGTAGNFNRLVVQNTESNCWLDNVWIKTNFDTATLTNNYNGDGLADAQEVNTYGYARRTLYVCQTDTNLMPFYMSITNAVAAWRPRDIIHVIAGNYSAENVVLAANPSNVVFEGDAFTVNSLTVVSNASASFAQTVSCGTLSLTGQVSMVSGASLMAATAQVEGSLSVSTNGSFVVTNLTVVGAGLVTFTTNATLVAVTAGVTLNGPFAVSNTWGSASVVSMSLPFSDNFDSYGEGTALTSLKFQGWNASDGTVKISTMARSGKAVVLPDGTILSNSLNSAGATNVWTDFYIQPVLGIEPAVPATNTSSFLAYVNTDGFLVVATAPGGWYVCSNMLDNSMAPALRTNGFTRITLYQNLSITPPNFAVFVDGYLVAQGLSSPASIHSYSAFGADNRHGAAYMDEVLITTVMPPGLSSDLNNNGLADAYEILTYGMTSERMARGTIFTFR